MTNDEPPDTVREPVTLESIGAQLIRIEKQNASFLSALGNIADALLNLSDTVQKHLDAHAHDAPLHLVRGGE